MTQKGCIRNLMEAGATSQEAAKRCGELYKSRTTPELYYRRIVPGEKSTHGRIALEKLVLKERRRKRYRGIPRG